MRNLVKRSVIDPKRSYIFSDYFELNIPINELVAYFGYSHHLAACTLPQVAIDLTPFAYLKPQLETHLQHTYLTSEAARREVLVAPVLLSIATFLNMMVQIEYPLNVTKQLKGKIDYYLQKNSRLLIIEAKYQDLPRGFNQLAVELIALDQWLDDDPKPLYGCVTVGNAWQFGILDRLTKQITQDIRLYTIPTELETLLQILIAILEG